MLKRTAQNQLTIFSAKFSRKFTSKNLDSIRPFEYKNNLKIIAQKQNFHLLNLTSKQSLFGANNFQYQNQIR
jgi:hypothetical protein